MGNERVSQRDPQPEGRRAWSALRGIVVASVVLHLGLTSIAQAQTFLCPPPPEGVFGLPGGPKFAESPLPDPFASQLDDPRWNGAWREDFATASSTEASARILREGDSLFLSLEARVDPNGAAANADSVYLGFSKDGVTAVMVKVTMTAGPPLTNSNQVQTSNSWKTTDGGATAWNTVFPPQTWATNAKIHAWSGAGTATGSAWAINAKLSLTEIGAALGLPGALGGPYFMWYEVDVVTPSQTVPYGWPSGSTVAFNGGGLPVFAVNSTTWGTVDGATCPTGISIDPMSIGTLPLSGAGIPSTTVHFGATHPANDFVAVMTDTGGGAISTNTVEGRFRIARWGSMIGVGGDWADMVTTGSPAVPVLGVNATTGSQVQLHCVNDPPFTAANPQCWQKPAGAPADQCLLVELAQHAGSGMKFVQYSARRNMDFVNASTFERSAEVSVRGLVPLAGSPGTRDVYLYVRTLNLPASVDKNPALEIPPPVPPVSRRPVDGVARVPEAAKPQASDQQPRYRQTTYDRVASVMPTYEVHVYHDSGRSRVEEGVERRILEPQAPFGYFVQHAGDLSGWRHALTGEGFVLEQIGPDYYHAKIPDNGAVLVHTKIDSCQRQFFGLINRCGGGCDCRCSVGGGRETSLSALALVAFFAIVCAGRRRRRR